MALTRNGSAELLVDENGNRSLVATRKIRQGEEILTLPSSALAQPDMFSIEVHPGLHIDCSFTVAGAINHRCNDFTAVVRDMRIVAWRCIEQGEEITINYRRTESKLAAPFTCSCCGEKMEW